jgi:hypothetical protein
MKAKFILRIAIVPVLIKLMGHTFGHTIWDQPKDPQMMEVVTTMKRYQGEFMGATKSMADYYNGYSLMILLVYVLTIFVLWFASGIITEHRAIAKKIVLPFGIAFFMFGMLEFMFFFPFAAIMSVVASVLTLASVTVAKQ